MTLPELLIAVTILGLVAAVLSSAVIVTIRQSDNTEGRINVARAEQSISMWLPADLASADTVDTSPSASPCGASVCDGIDLSQGSNVLMLTWTTEVNGTTVTTNVSYHFRPAGNTGLYELLRVECVGGSCTSQVVLRDLPGPPGGETFVPGVPNGGSCTPTGTVPCTRPDWVIIVSQPLAADAVSEDQLASESERKSANRVIVTINGGGDSSGAGGGINQISITAGGTVRTSIEANSVQGTPTFSEALSLCGGPMTLVIDESNSIGSAITEVEAGVQAFIEALAGTPVQLQVVRFHTYSSILASNDWHHYFDMTDPDDVEALLDHVGDLRGSWTSDSNRNGGTNWEEGLFRSFYNADGSTASIIPETIVFFTDGVPTFDRLGYKSSPGVLPADPPAPVAPWPASTGSAYSQVAFNRANYIANAFRRSVRFIGVGVGSGITASSSWIVDPGAGYRTVWERGYRQYQRVTGNSYESNHDFERSTNYQSNLDTEQATTFQSNLDTQQATTFQSRVDFELATTFQSRVDFEQKTGTNSWSDRTPTQYYAGNTTSNESDGWRINGTRSWYNVTQSEYASFASLSASNWSIGGWSDRTPTQYYAGNTTSNESDGWRINGTRSWYNVTQSEYADYASLSASNWSIGGWSNRTPAQYYAGNTNSGESDGWRIDGTRSWYNVSQSDYSNWASLSSSNWSIGGWTDRTPAQYYAGNTTSNSNDGWRINGTRSWYNVSQSDYNSWASQSPSNWTGGWTDVTVAQYFAGNTTSNESDGWRINGVRPAWYAVTQAEYTTHNTTSNSNDGWRTTQVISWITKAEYTAGNTTSDATDGYIDVGSPEYVAAGSAKDWVAWPGERTGDQTTYRSTKLYNSPPYEGFEPAETVGTGNSTILARLIAGNDNGTPALPSGGPYSNTEIADMYVLPNWSQFRPAMEAVALGECGGTLTLQTKINGTNPAPDPFRYQRTAVLDSAGTALPVEASVVTTSQQFTTGTFDLPVEDGTFVTVEIRPQNYSDLSAYTPGSWSCRAGVTNRPFTLVNIPDGGAWKGIRVQVAANEAVSCTLSVTK